MFEYGTIVNFPSITWPSHNALGTGAWCGHHDTVNPTYHLREKRETITPQGMMWETGKYVTGDVETMYEAVHRVWGKWDGKQGEVTASINEPCMRGAGHATLERRMLVDTAEMSAMVKLNKDDTCPRWKADNQNDAYRASGSDIQGTVQSMLLFGADDKPPPKFTFHEFSLTDAVGHDYGPHHDAVFDAVIETDKRIGKILGVLDARGLFDSTLFVITTDHGMAPIDTSLAADQTKAVSRRRPELRADGAADLPARHGRDARAVRRWPHPARDSARKRRRRARRTSTGRRRRRAGDLARRARSSPRRRPTRSASAACRCLRARTPSTSSSASSTRSSTPATCAWTARTWSRTSGSGCMARTSATSPTEQRLILKDGRTLGFAGYGDPNGKPVLEFHGWPGSRLEAWSYDEAGKQTGARVIGIDRPGFGISTYKKGYRIVDWPSDVLEFANTLGLERFAVAGISSGSPYSLACARFIPERLTACAVVSGISPLKVTGEKLKPKHYLEPTEIQIARLANTVPFAARTAFWYISRQIRKDPDKALKQFTKDMPPSDLELLKDPAAKQNFVRRRSRMLAPRLEGAHRLCWPRNEGLGLSPAGRHDACQPVAGRRRQPCVPGGRRLHGLEATEPQPAHDR